MMSHALGAFDTVSIRGQKQSGFGSTCICRVPGATWGDDKKGSYKNSKAEADYKCLPGKGGISLSGAIFIFKPSFGPDSGAKSKKACHARGRVA